MVKVTRANPNKPQRRKMPLSTVRNTATKKIAYVCVGGPYNGETLHLSTPYTAVFKVGSYYGKYQASEQRTLQWEDK